MPRYLTLPPADLRALRESVDWSQRELAKLLEVDPQTVYRWERSGRLRQKNYLRLVALTKEKMT